MLPLAKKPTFASSVSVPLGRFEESYPRAYLMSERFVL